MAWSRVFAVLFFSLIASKAVAAPIYFTDRVSFNAAAGALQFQSFESNPQANASVTYGDLTFTETGGTNNITNTAFVNFAASVTHGNNAIWFDDNGDSVATVTFGAASPITAFGIDLTSNENTTIAIGGGANTSINLIANTPSFFGMIDTGSPFSSLTFTASGGPNLGFDAVSYGTAAVAAEVPEPASIALWSMLSVAGLAAWRRRKSAVEIAA